MADILNQSNNVFAITITMLLLLGAYLIRSIVGYKEKIHKQNMQLIKLYLDRKFITKLLSALGDSNNTQDVLEPLIDDVKEYFQMDDAIIYSPDLEQTAPLPGVYHRSMILEYMKDNNESIMRTLRAEKIVIDTFCKNAFKAALYIMSLSRDGKILIVFTQHSGRATLDNYEIETLNNAIIGILSSAFRIKQCI